MTKGVRHGKLIMRDSDDARPKSRVRRNRYRASEANVVNCVIFVVSAVQILQLMDSGDETKTQQTQTVATTFNYPVLSFKDEKPIVVLTHGDLLSPADRTRIRMYLGQLLGIHPKKQIFDIPESDDFGTRLTILNMLRHCLEHADKNLPFKKDLPFKDPDCSKVALQMLVCFLLTYVALAILFGMGMMFRNNLQAKLASVPDSQASQSNVDTDWHATIVDSVPILQPETMQPHPNFDFHASEVDFIRDLHPEAHQSDENLDWGTTQPDVNMDCHASEVDSVCDLQPEAPQSDEMFDWGAIRHLWSD